MATPGAETPLDGPLVTKRVHRAGANPTPAPVPAGRARDGGLGRAPINGAARSLRVLPADAHGPHEVVAPPRPRSVPPTCAGRGADAIDAGAGVAARLARQAPAPRVRTHREVLRRGVDLHLAIPSAALEEAGPLGRANTAAGEAAEGRHVRALGLATTGVPVVRARRTASIGRQVGRSRPRHAP